VTRFGYTAYGDQTIMSHTGASQTNATYSIRHTYTGRKWDDSLKAHYFRARWYDATLGRFVNRDPIGYVDGASLYRGYFSMGAVDFLGQMVIRQIKDTYSVIFVDDLDGGDGVNVASGEQMLKKAESWAAKMQNPGCVIKSLRKIEDGCESPFELHHSYGVPETACVDFAAIFDHGNQRGPSFGDHHWNPSPTNKTNPVVPEKWSEDICGLLCDNATVFLLGCKVGLSEYPQELADRCGRNITVYACPSSCGGWGRKIGDPTLNCPDGIDEYKKGMAKKKIGGKLPGSWDHLLSQVNPIGCSKKP
jgi:RHS repeat-associated protein